MIQAPRRFVVILELGGHEIERYHVYADDDDSAKFAALEIARRDGVTDRLWAV